MKVFGQRIQQEQCKFVEYQPNGALNSLKKFLGRNYETEESPTCSYLYRITGGLRKTLYLCQHKGNLVECKKANTLDQKFKEYEDLRRKIEANTPHGIMDAVDRLNTFFTLKDYEIIISPEDSSVYSLLESLRKKARISDICVDDMSLEEIVNILEKSTLTKEKIEYISALKEAASGKLDPSKYTTPQLGPGVKLVKFEIRDIKHKPNNDEGD